MTTSQSLLRPTLQSTHCSSVSMRPRTSSASCMPLTPAPCFRVMTAPLPHLALRSHRHQRQLPGRQALQFLLAVACSSVPDDGINEPAAHSGSRAASRPGDKAALEQSYRSFDWTKEWYPVAFVRDMPIGKLVRITLFEETYAVVRRPQGGPAALADRCPHRLAALSEGLLTPEGLIQCAYHGWKLDGVTGECKNIPQQQPGATYSKGTCGTAFPCVEHQGMVWLKPDAKAKPDAEARSADSSANQRSPNDGAGDAESNFDQLAVLPELDRPGWVADDFVRDFDVDYTLILENLMDPDHGLFAHQATYFDSYSAGAGERMTVNTGVRHGRPTIRGSVPGVLKFTRKPADGVSQERALFSEKEGHAADMDATIEFQAPCHVRWSRFDKEGGTSFITAFYAVPTGVGRSRLLLRYCRSIAPKFKLPTWAFAIAMNRFLDQDTFLLATQQPATLEAEMQAVAAQHSQNGSNGSGGGGAAISAAKRNRLFCYQSPSDLLLQQAGAWIDAAVPQMPNRAQVLLGAHAAAPGSGVLGRSGREVSLDRWAMHTEICPDSMAAFQTFRRLRVAFGGAAAVGGLALLFHIVAGHTPTAALWPGVAATIASTAVAAAVQALAQQFTYVYTRAAQEKDLAKLPKLTANLNYGGPLPKAATKS